MLNTEQAAKKLGISKSTLLRLIRKGSLPDVARDRNNWRIFSESDIEKFKRKIGRTS